MKKLTLCFAAALVLILLSCNDHNSANKNNEKDASNSTMDETGPANHMQNDSAVNNTNVDMENAQSTGTTVNSQSTAAESRGSNGNNGSNNR